MARMTLEDDLRKQRATWDSMKSQWGEFRIPEGIVKKDYYPGVCITLVRPPQMKPTPHRFEENTFERIMRERYGIKVQTQKPNYRPYEVKLKPFYEDE